MALRFVGAVGRNVAHSLARVTGWCRQLGARRARVTRLAAVVAGGNKSVLVAGTGVPLPALVAVPRGLRVRVGP